MKADGPRKDDFTIVYDSSLDQEMIYPCANKGLSFADCIAMLSSKKIEGYVWVLPKGKILPEGLIFNVKDIGHPLLNISHVISVLDMTTRLCQLADMMEPCQVKIDKTGNIIEEVPGSLAKAAQRW